MSGEQLPPLDGELDRLLESERTVVAPADALDRVWSRLALPPVVGVPSAKTGPGREGASQAWSAALAYRVALGAFVIGGVVGGVLVSELRAPRIVYLDRPALRAATPEPPPPLPLPAPAAATEGTSIEPESLPHAPIVRPIAAANARTVEPGSSLTAERLVLDQARAALAQGDGPRALSLTDAHAHRFAHPVLAEEREALAVQALVIGGRYEDARARGSRFRSTFPNSLFLPAVEASIGSIP